MFPAGIWSAFCTITTDFTFKSIVKGDQWDHRIIESVSLVFLLGIVHKFEKLVDVNRVPVCTRSMQQL